MIDKDHAVLGYSTVTFPIFRLHIAFGFQKKSHHSQLSKNDGAPKGGHRMTSSWFPCPYCHLYLLKMRTSSSMYA
jgi:hypothetical protein